ncbi:hypothetical protein BU603_00640 [Staphylococcus arlettae]|nr:hypothetical protein BU603_00640 [Staphylococcus arlettae]
MVLKRITSYNNEKDAWCVLYPLNKMSSWFTLIVDDKLIKLLNEKWILMAYCMQVRYKHNIICFDCCFCV